MISCFARQTFFMFCKTKMFTNQTWFSCAKLYKHLFCCSLNQSLVSCPNKTSIASIWFCFRFGFGWFVFLLGPFHFFKAKQPDAIRIHNLPFCIERHSPWLHFQNISCCKYLHLNAFLKAYKEKHHCLCDELICFIWGINQSWLHNFVFTESTVNHLRVKDNIAKGYYLHESPWQ